MPPFSAILTDCDSLNPVRIPSKPKGGIDLLEMDE